MAELSTLARPYAKAAFEYAVDAKDLQGWSDSLALAASVAQQPAVEKLLSSPSATAAVQAEAVRDICGDELVTASQNFISILSENRRLQLFRVGVVGPRHEMFHEVESTGKRFSAYTGPDRWKASAIR
jgi:F-type H+-transporting ATPase subunit delta